VTQCSPTDMKVIGAGDHDFKWTKDDRWDMEAFKCPDCGKVPMKHGCVERSDGKQGMWRRPYNVPTFFGLFNRTKYETTFYVEGEEVYECSNCNKVWQDDYFYGLDNTDAPGYNE